MLQTKVVEKNQNSHFMFNIFLPNIVAFMRLCGKIWYSRTGHRWQYNTANVLCMLDNWGCRNTLRIRNNYCFSTARTVRRSHRSNTICVIPRIVSKWKCAVPLHV